MTGKLTLTVKCVTPVFLGGSQARELADSIRPASIRGQVRYWLRAMLGASINPANPDDALKELKRREGGLMGDTEAGSPVRFRVRANGPLQYVGKNSGGRMMLPHRMAGVPDTPQNIRDRQPLPEAAFVESQSFNLILSPRPGRKAIPDEVVAATLLWLYLGGLGKRARRGFGSLQPVKCVASGEGIISNEAREHLPAGNPADAAALRGRINALLGWMGGVAPIPIGLWVGRSLWPILHEDVAGVRVSEAVTGYNLTDYHQAMVPFWVESLRSIALRDDRAYGYARPNDRRASPFHLHIAHSAQGYHQVFTTFWSNPAPNGAAGWTKVGDLLTDVETEFGATNLWGRAK